MKTNHRVNTWVSFALGLVVVAPAGAAYSLDVEYEVAPPPSPGSAAEKEDFRELRRLQNTRTEEECEAADAQTRMTAWSFFGPPTGILSREEHDSLEPLLSEVIETVNKETRPYKEEYARERPYVKDHSISPCIQMPKGNTSYPSSHAAAGIAAGHVLESLFPGRATEIREEAMQVGENRLIGGVHHPSDVETGRDLGEQIWEALEENTTFRRDLAKARKAVGR
jgi:acid phosphatase (class A)